jgi:hypothetical protein
VIRNTPRTPEGILVLPGNYQGRLTVGGQSYRRAVTVRMDPRVKTPLADLTLQSTLSRSVNTMLTRLAAARDDVAQRLGGVPADNQAALRQLAADLDAVYAPLPGC